MPKKGCEINYMDTRETICSRHACSSQILYLLNPTKITTNTETAMLSNLYNLLHLFIFISLNLFLRYLYTFCRGFSSWNVPSSNQINKRKKKQFCCEKYFQIVKTTSCCENILFVVKNTLCCGKYFLSWKILLVVKKYFLLWASFVAHTLSGAVQIESFASNSLTATSLDWDGKCNGKFRNTF